MSAREWSPGEVPPFAFCEPSYAGSLRPWCIRRVGPEGLKLGGGVPTGERGPLCRTWACNGWDLNVRILPEHLDYRPGTRAIVCHECAAEYKAATVPPSP